MPSLVTSSSSPCIDFLCVLVSDIVICRMWVPVPVKDWYVPVSSLFAPYDYHRADVQNNNLVLMRNTAQIRREEKIAIPLVKDSLYKPIERLPREFKKLTIPTKLQEQLPFASKPKNSQPVAQTKSKNAFLDTSVSLQKRSRIRAHVEGGSPMRAVLSEPTERRERALLSMLSTVRKDKVAKREAAATARAAEKAKAKQREAARFEDVHKVERKRKYREAGQREAAVERKSRRTG
eukprot:scaffold9386_cov154-Ochromonas_danica.AAC.15